MKRVLGLILGVALAGNLLVLSAAQNKTKKPGADDTCAQPVYKKKEVTRPAKITSRVQPQNDEHLQGRVVATAVLCRTGKVTDVLIKFGLSYATDRRVIEAVRKTTFTPAEKDGQPVSQEIRFEYLFDRIP